MDTSLTWLDRLVESPSGTDWERLVVVYSPLLQSWTRRAGVSDADRDDLVQEVLIVVVRRVSEFDRTHSGAFRGWLRAILMNHLKKYFRESNRQTCGFPLDTLVEQDSELANLLDREHDEQVARHLMKLVEHDFTPATWTAFREQVVKGRQATEVAQELNLSINAVIKAKSRVLQRLRQEFAGWFEVG